MTDEIAPPSSIKISWFLGVFGAFLIFVVIAAYSSRMANDTPAYDQGRAAERLAILAKQRDADEKTLTTADWVDQTKGTVRVPIDEAMPETITTLKAKPVQMSGVIPGTMPATMNTISTGAANQAPAGATNAAPGTNAAPSAPPAPAAPNK